MTVIEIHGAIGWDITADTVKQKLKWADDDVIIDIDSPGGSVFQGLSIIEAIKKYNKGTVTCRVGALAASMASVIMLSGKGKPVFSKNSTVMIHNPWGVAIGDYREMQSYGDLLVKLTGLLRGIYLENTDFSEDMIKQYMDNTKWFVGAEELSQWGSVEDSSEEDEDKELLQASAVERFNVLKAKFDNETIKNDLDKVAALTSGFNFIQGNVRNKNINNVVQVNPVNEMEVKDMDKTKLKAEHPDLYNEIKQEGCLEERQRISQHMDFMDIAPDVAKDAIKSGVTFAELQSKYMRAGLDANKITAMQAASPKAIEPGEVKPTGKGEEPEEIVQAQKKQEKELEKALASCGLKFDESAGV